MPQLKAGSKEEEESIHRVGCNPIYLVLSCWLFSRVHQNENGRRRRRKEKDKEEKHYEEPNNPTILTSGHYTWEIKGPPPKCSGQRPSLLKVVGLLSPTFFWIKVPVVLYMSISNRRRFYSLHTDPASFALFYIVDESKKITWKCICMYILTLLAENLDSK